MSQSETNLTRPFAGEICVYSNAFAAMTESTDKNHIARQQRRRRFGLPPAHKWTITFDKERQ